MGTLMTSKLEKNQSKQLRTTYLKEFIRNQLTGISYNWNSFSTPIMKNTEEKRYIKRKKKRGSKAIALEKLLLREEPKARSARAWALPLLQDGELKQSRRSFYTSHTTPTVPKPILFTLIKRLFQHKNKTANTILPLWKSKLHGKLRI